MIKISFLETAVPVEAFQTVLPEVIIGNTQLAKGEIVTNQGYYSFPWLIVYVIGVVTSIFVLFSKIIKLLPYFKYKQLGKNIIEIPESKEAFTLFNYIFIGKDIDKLSRKQILIHERIHVKQKHTWDLLFFELLRIVMWFNPFIYVFQKQTSIIHEYLADQKAVNAQSKKEYFEQLLNAAFGTEQLSFTNTFFNHSLIKKRITMLQKSKSKRITLIKYTLIVPLVLAMLVYTSCSKENELETEQSLEQQIASLKFAIEEKGEISESETQLLNELNKSLVGKSNMTLVYSYSPDNNGKDIEEVVEQRRLEENGENIPFAVIDEVPVFPGCEGLSSNAERKQCMSSKISESIGSNFDTSIGKKLGLSGVTRIFATFKIDKNGYISGLRTRSPHPSLDLEAERVISMIPKMEPGKQNGEPVSVLYSLPITFAISE
ncbi:M56 family metallopeptidase [Dokdonia sp. Hel_I_53]|uniref:M56 family metallopeptidase n=1 Tax=Dokdonia sp. Hel_I_53 TaxID=1566287 RepID=UPI0016459226|nr:M56 family metallopeptidase [Dokdonia sp. Hel_I_53]